MVSDILYGLNNTFQNYITFGNLIIPNSGKMSVGGSLTHQVQLQQELQNELTVANQLLQQISIELQKIKCLTNPGGEFEKNIKQNAELLVNLSSIQKLDLEKVPHMKRLHLMDTTQNTNQNISYEQHDSFRISMDESR